MEEVRVNIAGGIKAVEYQNGSVVAITTTRGEVVKFNLSQIKGDKQSYIEKIIFNREIVLKEKDIYLNKIDEYNKQFPNNGCEFMVSFKEKTKTSTWDGFYIRVVGINPTSKVVSIPYICDVFEPRYSNSLLDLKVVADKGTSLKSANELFRRLSVRSLDLSELDISCLGRLAGMFHSHKSTSINVSNWNISSIKDNSLSGLFRYIKVDTIVGLETWNTSSVKDFTQLFYQAEVKNLNISNWDLSSIITKDQTSIGIAMSSQVFSFAKLGAIDLSKWDVSRVSHFRGWFVSCKIDSIGDISSWNVSNAVCFDFMFQNSKFGNSVDMKKWNMSQSSTKKDMFKNCSLIK